MVDIEVGQGLHAQPGDVETVGEVLGAAPGEDRGDHRMGR
jgi:hypothetical protein